MLDYAYRHFQRATVLDSCDAASYDGMARLWRDWGMPDLALSDVYRALHCNGKSAEIYNTIGTILETLGQQPAAERAYQRALALDPRRDVCAQQPLLHRDGEGQRTGGGALVRRSSRVGRRISRPPGTTLRSSTRGAATSPAPRRVCATGAPSGTSLYNVGVLRLSEGRYVDAAAAFDQAAVTQPTLTIARQRSVQARKAARAAEQAR